MLMFDQIVDRDLRPFLKNKEWSLHGMCVQTCSHVGA